MCYICAEILDGLVDCRGGKIGLRILCFNGDLGGCFEYRVRIPMNELKRFGVQYVALPELPNNPFGDDFSELCRYIDQFDLVILQRCYKIEVATVIKSACEILGKKLVFETDDDYFHLPQSNPCYAEMARPGMLQNYARILQMADLVTVSTKELKDTIYRFNKNVQVLENNVESILSGEQGEPARAHSVEVVENGKVKLNAAHGLVSIPSYYTENGKKNRVVRIGYSGTPSHHEDWETVRFAFEKLIKKYESKIWIVFIGDKYFFDKTVNASGRKMFIPVSQYQLYLYHLRNIDIGLAPLVPNIFNMSKSAIKAVEYGMWGTPAVVPHYVTYTRSFTNGLNCLSYYNAQEFYECLEELINNHELRTKLGTAARDLVATKHLERDHAQKRFDVYEALVSSSTSKRFQTVKA